MKIVAIIQARYGSSRLPGKVLLPIGDKPMLQHVIERVRLAKRVDEVVLATTTDPSDDPVADLCRMLDTACERGSLFDVLDRYYQAARAHQADVIVRITGDCPLIDPAEIDRTVEAFLRTGADFAANRLPPPFKRTYPIGLDTEVCSMAALERAWKEAKEPFQREHVMPYLYDHAPVIEEKDFTGFPPETPFKVLYLNNEQDYGRLRWTVDTQADLDLVRLIFARLGGRSDYSWKDVLALVEAEPDLMRVNAGVVHRTMNDVDARAGKEQHVVG